MTKNNREGGTCRFSRRESGSEMHKLLTRQVDVVRMSTRLSDSVYMAVATGSGEEG